MDLVCSERAGRENLRIFTRGNAHTHGEQQRTRPAVLLLVLALCGLLVSGLLLVAKAVCLLGKSNGGLPDERLLVKVQFRLSCTDLYFCLSLLPTPPPPTQALRPSFLVSQRPRSASNWFAIGGEAVDLGPSLGFSGWGVEGIVATQLVAVQTRNPFKRSLASKVGLSGGPIRP